MTDKNIDQAKGRLKEAAGALTGDQGLKNEGHADQAKGSLRKSWSSRQPQGSRPEPEQS